MAGLYITTKYLATDCAKNIFTSLSFSCNAWESEFKDNEVHCILSRLDRKDIWGPAEDDDNRIRVYLSGRIALEESEWNKEINLVKRGGLAASYLIKEYLEKGLQLIDSLNGAFAILIIDKEKQKTYFITDRMGFYPAYAFEDGESVSVSTNNDTLAKINNQMNELDITSVAEVLKFGYCAHPNTYYKRIKQLDPGSIYEIKRNKLTKIKQYWAPQPKFIEQNNKKLLVEDLESAIRAAVKRRTQKILGEVGIFLSAGADSRTILAASEDPTVATSFTFYDVENNEYKLAKRIAEAYGSKHIGLKRHPEHYGLGAEFAAKVISGHWNITDVHYANFIDQLNELNIQNYLSGCFTDFLFKGIAYNRTHMRLFNKNLPLYKLIPFQQQWYFGISTLQSAYDSLSSERNLSPYNGINTNAKNELTYWQIESVRLFPISREATFGSRQFLFRTLPWDPVLADNDLLELFQKIPPKWKINGEIWKNAAYNLTSKAKNVVDNNTLAPLNYNKAGIIYKFLQGVIRRKIKGVDVDGTPLNSVITRGSWPNLYYYLKSSKVLEELWNKNQSTTEELFTQILGLNPYNYTAAKWADKDMVLFYRMLTIKLWLENIWV